MIDFQYATLSSKTQGSGVHASNDDQISSYLACSVSDPSDDAA
jgi:hypothetical protein